MENLKVKLEQDRRRMLVGLWVGFGTWQASRILDSLLSGPGGVKLLRPILLISALFGWGYWVVHLARMIRVQHVIAKDPQLCAALDDEFIRHSRLRALALAFWAVLASQAAVAGAGVFVDLDAVAAANVALLLGVSTAVGAFLVFTRE